MEQEDDYYKPIRKGNFLSNNCIEYKNNSDKNKNLSAKEYLNEVKLYLRDLIVNPQKSRTWKVQLFIIYIQTIHKT